MLDFHLSYGKKWAGGKNNSKSYQSMLIDSAIVGAIVFFSTWNGSLDINNLLNAIKGFGLAFFTQLAYYRGLKR
jgi:hypothetical protein